MASCEPPHRHVRYHGLHMAFLPDNFLDHTLRITAPFDHTLRTSKYRAWSKMLRYSSIPCTLYSGEPSYIYSNLVIKCAWHKTPPGGLWTMVGFYGLISNAESPHLSFMVMDGQAQDADTFEIGF